MSKTIHFYGLGFDEFNTMPVDDFMDLYNSITIIEAQEMLRLLQVADYPNMGKEDRKKLFDGLKKAAYPSRLKGASKEKGVSTKELFSRMKNGR